MKLLSHLKKIIKKIAQGDIGRNLDGDIVILSEKGMLSGHEFFDVLNNAANAIILFDNSYTIQYANKNTLLLTGYAELKGVLLTELFPAKTNSQLYAQKLIPEAIDAVIRTKTDNIIQTKCLPGRINISETEYLLIKLNVDQNLIDNASLVKEPDGIPTTKVTQNVANPTDTGNVDFSKYQLVFESLSDPVFILDLHGKFIDANKRTVQVLGYSMEQLITMKITETIKEESREQFLTSLKDIHVCNSFIFETYQLTAAGKVIPVEINACISNFSGEEVIICSARIITLRKRYENELIEIKGKAVDSEKELQIIFDSSAVPMFLINKNLIVQKLNKTAMNFFNARENELINKPLDDIIRCLRFDEESQTNEFGEKPGSISLFDLIEQTIQTGKTFEKEEIEIVRLESDKAGVRTMLVSIKPLLNTKNFEILVTLDDITERKIIENELIDAKQKAEESNRLKTVFLNNLSHELRTPLNGILGFSELLINTDTLKEMKQFSELINKSGKRLLNIIEDLFTVSSIISKSVQVQPRVIKLSGFIENARIMLREEHIASNSDKVELKFNISEKAVEKNVIIDPSIYLLIIKKLARNAFKFTPSGSVEFGVQDLSSKGITFYIKDTGIGIAPEMQEQIFQFFRQVDEDSTRHYGGTGTGLSISKSLVELSEGEIWIDSAPNEGSTFYFTIPVKNIVKGLITEAKSGSEADSSISLEGKKILIVEDDDFNYLLLEAVLNGIGVKTIHSENGEKAVDIVKTDKQIDLILMDLRLPDLTGFETTRRIRSLNTSIPIIAQSALSRQEDIDEALNAGCNDFISKPFDTPVLLKKISIYIN
jgi:PAS domain S-box-containing protein